ncbi:tripartite tricarboxylate transporter substrate binding protein [Actinophytocola gossypii]|uniref:Tripartite tricarboxylate transporter substrate binding protein n=1 Tax=Actinophytocola gossypii TaxID=2812003 RepID=A0ABT2J1V9_9PSEU|nr:tripartite tricarboxylate transporter substrate binding protein [Actinophytocola gossypii]MCT2581840.1 tripartite tricarboxylate transporter substrate binding protein [Actinophytocola gossypii]
MRRIVALVLAVVLTCGGCAALRGSTVGYGDPADFPRDQPVTILLPFTAGGSSDLLVRALAPFLAEELGVEVIVENRVGAGGQVAITQLSIAPADGYTIGLTNLPSTLAYLNPDKVASYDRSSFTPLAGVNRFRGMLTVAGDGGWRTMADLVRSAKERPGELTVGVDGLTGDDHIAALELEHAIGADLKIVPFDSGSEKLIALVGGEVDLSLGTVPTFEAQLSTGELRALAALDDEPIPGYEDVPTAIDAGYDLVWDSYNVLSAPAGLDPVVADRLESAIEAASAAALADPAFVDQMEAGGYVFGFRPADEVAGLWADLEDKWDDLIPLARAQS